MTTPFPGPTARTSGAAICSVLLWLCSLGNLAGNADEQRTVNIDLVGASAGAGGRSAADNQELPASFFLAGARHGFEHSASISGFSLAGSYPQVYPGMTLACYMDEHHVEYAFLLAAGADPSRIRLLLNDVRFDAVTAEGNMIYTGDGFDVYQHAPAIFQLDGEGGRRPVDGHATIIGGAETSVTMGENGGENAEPLNNSRFNIVPADCGREGPAYDFFMSRYEVTNEQWIRFLNNAQMNLRNPRGENMFFDQNGNVWINAAMQPERDELFSIQKARILYNPDRAAGDRYSHAMDDRGRYPYADHPAVGISWFGSVKYCNWLTLESGRGPNEVCYREGTNIYDWAPVTSTNWANGFFTASERTAWLARKGFRLPMFRLYDPESGGTTNTFNEFLKAGSWNGNTNVPYGYGRATYTTNDANAVDASMISNGETLPVGYFNGQNRLPNGRALFNENGFGLHDMSGNVAEWLNDPARAGVPDARSLAGGSFQNRIRPLSEDVIVPPYANDGSGGFRPVTTFMPDSWTQVNILFCFHTTNAIPSELRDRFGLTPETPTETKPAITTETAPGAPGTPSGDMLAPGVDTPPAVSRPIEPGIIYKDPTEPPEEPEPPLTPGNLGRPGGGGGPLPPPPPPPLGLLNLDVYSENPNAGVGISISTADYYGRDDGISTFRRQYEPGSNVTLTAPASAGGNLFQHWMRDGVVFSTSRVITVQMISDLQLTAVYAPPGPPELYILDVYSENPDARVGITISNPDYYDRADGMTDFRRQYEFGEEVSLTAPATAGGNVFQYWLRNGVPFSTSPSITVQMLSDLQLTAVYLSPVPPIQRTLVVDSTPGRNVPVVISVEDNNGQQNGNTLLSRIYDNRQQVTVTAPATFNGKSFLGWLRNGVPYSPNPTATVTMLSDVTLTARYGQTISIDERNLTVTSSNPDSGVAIAVSTPDLSGNQNGDTTFNRRYEFAETVTLTAPTVAPNGNTFARWLRNGVLYSTNETITVEMITDIVLTAEYISPPPDVVLTVRSTTPNSGVNISVSTPDNDGATDGATTFTRHYDIGTSTTLTAPAVAPNGNEFRQWVLNGAPLSTNSSVTLTLLADAELIAVYLPPIPPPPNWNLNVLSDNPDSGVSIAVSTADINNDSSGSTAFGRTYRDGTQVSLTAPATAPDGNVFSHWLVDGVMYSDRESITLIMTTNRTVTAVYVEPSPLIRHVLTVTSRNPNSSIVVTVNPADVNGQQNGTTTFTRLYDDGQTVTLTARNPAFPGSSNQFRQWLLDGTPISTNATMSVTMRRDTTVTAVYGPALPQENHTLTVESRDPGSGVPITVSAPDINTGETSGNTTFDRLYGYGTPVTVTAPPVAPNGNLFQHWLLNGNLFSTDAAVTLSMLGEMRLTAVYAPPPIERTLTVNSRNPDSGVNIQVSTPDNRANQDGTTSFQRFYDDEETVTLTAPPVSPNGRDVFLRWERDGVPVTTNTVIDVTLYRDIEMTAVYGPPLTFDLTIKSDNPDRNLPVAISTPDILGRTDGNSLFVRTYNPGENVTVTAPEVSPTGTVFQQWLRNGIPFSSDRTLNIAMLGDVELTAVYGPPDPINRSLIVRSVNPDSNVQISISPDDIRNQGDGNTGLLRIYKDGETVTLTAPATAGTNSFRQWILNGSPISTNLTETVVMSQDHELIAVYGPPVRPEDRVLTVDSRNPNSGVPVTVSQPDISGNTDGNSVFVRIYTYGDTTTLTAPEISGTNNTEFLRWERDGVPFSEDRTVTIEMLTDVRMTVVYGEVPRDVTLTVASLNPDSGVIISVAPGDLNSETTGTTTFNRLYGYGETVTLTAPTTAEDRPFLHWLYNGVVMSTNTVISVNMLSDLTMTAVYGDPVPPGNVTLTVRSQGPDGAIITLIGATPDITANAGGSTEFQRTYINGTPVTLTAPPTSNGFDFHHWEVGGAVFSSSQIVSLTLLANTTITAVYVEPIPSVSGL